MSPSKKKKKKVIKISRITIPILVIGLLVGLIIPIKKSPTGIHMSPEEAFLSAPNSNSANIISEIKKVFFKGGRKVQHDSLRGVYITAATAASKNFDGIIDTLVESGGNAIVLDVEVSGGKLAFIPKNKELAAINPGTNTLKDPRALIEKLHKKDVYVIARQVIFNDPYTAGVKPEWQIKYKNGSYFDNRWLDPSHPDAQAYNLAITREVAALGFDEVQYDYIRFPAKNHQILSYHYDESAKEPWEVINDFLKDAKKVSVEEDIVLGIDVFGATIWGDIDWRSVGQNIPELAQTVDVIYPMTYPSHVSPGYYGFMNPWGDPGSFVEGSIRKFVEAANGQAEIRTWVQGFPLKTKNFGSWYMKAQVNGTYKAGANDFIIWSPGNRYGYSWSSLGLIPDTANQ